MSGWGPLSSRGFQSTCPLCVQGARHRLGWRMRGAEKDTAIIGGMDVLEPDLSALEVGSSVVHSGRL